MDGNEKMQKMKKLTNVIMKIKKKLKVIEREIKRISRSLNRKKYLSFGENCLADDILSRYNLKSFSSPFASGRANVEYVLQFQKENYKDFLNPQFLKYGYEGDLKVVRHKKYNELSNVYEDSCMKGFEFTHHDIIADEKKRASIERRVRRIQSLKNCTLYIFYHHRFCKDTDINLLIQHLNELKTIYEKQCEKVYLIAFTQKLVSSEQERKVDKEYIDGIYMYYFYTLNVWCGNNQDIFWARCDDDLISQMIGDIKELL